MSDQLRELIARTITAEARETRDFDPDAMAAAVLALFDVEEQYGLTWREGYVEWFDSPDEASSTRAEWVAQVPESAGRLKRVNRWTLTTQPLPVEENQPE